jgi:Leucine-rich repeat (LRR) protein
VTTLNKNNGNSHSPALRYPDSTTANGRAVRWLIENDLGTDPSDERALRQRYALATLWFQKGTNSGNTATTTTTQFNKLRFWQTWTNVNLHECDWHDVTCDAAGQITQLRLEQDGVMGQLPADLVLLTDLTALYVRDNPSLTGTIPSSWGEQSHWTALTALGLRGNPRLTGTIPSTLGHLTALTELVLAENQLSGTIPSTMGHLTNLARLLLWNNRLTGTIPASLRSLTSSLNSTRLDGNRLHGTVPFCHDTHNNSSSNSTTLVQLEADCGKVTCPCCTKKC